MHAGIAVVVAAVELQDGACRPYHVGDSVVFVIGGRGKVKHESIAHSPVGYGVESGLLDAREAIHHEDRHLVSNYIGSESMHIAIGPTLAMAARDTVLLASDGLVDNLRLKEIADTIQKGELRETTQLLAERARYRMTVAQDGQPSKPDDLTIVAFRLFATR